MLRVRLGAPVVKLAGPRRRWTALAAMLALVAAALLGPRLGGACPFCAAVSLTFCEEINGADVAVVAKLVKPADPAGNVADVGKAKFEVVDRLKGDKELSPGKKLEALYFGDSPAGSLFLITGSTDSTGVNWTTPILITAKARDYLLAALRLPKEGADRMVFFQDYLEDSDEILARDAYDEFAKTPYTGIKDLKGRIKHDKLIGWIQDPKVAPSRRRLYLTMLGVCGQKQDAELLETMIRSNDRQVKSGLDAMIAAYLTLKGPEGMPLVEDLFLKKQDADYTETYAAIMALRFHGQEETIVPRPRLLQGLHYMLDRPQLADLVIADLARWQDWGAMDRLVTLFKNATDETSWVRVPVINFLQACPLPEAKEKLAELAKIDPDAVKKATSLFPVGPAAGRGSSAADGAKPDAGSSEKDSGKKKDDSAQLPSADEDQIAAEPAAEADVVAADDADSDSDATAAGQTLSAAAPAARSRLSRAAAPVATVEAPQQAPHVLAWMALAGCILGLSFWGILVGTQKTT